MRLDNLLRFDYWLDASVTTQPAGPAMWLVVVTGVLGCALTGIASKSGRISRGTTIPWLIAAGLVAGVGLGRLFAIPVLGWRAGWLIAALLVVTPPATRMLSAARVDGLVDDCLNALSFGPPRAAGDWRMTTAALWLALHLLGLSVVLANLALPTLLAPALLALLLAPFIVASVLRRARGQPAQRWTLSALAPLVITYITTWLSFSGVRLFGVFNGILSPLLSLIVMSAFALAIGGRWAMTCVVGGRDEGQAVAHGEQRFVCASAALLVIAAVVWSAWAAMTLRTHGVTGSDPYAYAQMGVDLVTRGTISHPFPLARITYALDIPSHPIVHVGYRIPDSARYEATTVWPPGYAAFTGLAYLLAGERGLYLVTPLLNLMTLAATAWFAHHMSRTTRRPVHTANDYAAPYAVAALTVMFTATSYQQVEWQMAPMADIAAQLFTLLAVGLAFATRAGTKQHARLCAALSGLCLGIAFGIRYTQVLLAPAIALAIMLDDERWALAPRRAGLVILCAVTALLAALPVLAYHQHAFGNPFATGSEELMRFSLTRLPETALRTLNELNHYREFGLLTPLILLGLVAAIRHQPSALIVLSVTFVVLFSFHAAYTYLRPRDILFLFPLLSWLAALGTVESVRRSLRLHGAQPTPPANAARLAARAWAIARITLLCGLSFLFVLRAMETLAMPVTRGFGGFGYLVREQRASFDRLGQMTPPNAVVGCSLNSGAVDLHAQRRAFRPAGWTADELVRFVGALHREGTPVFLLDDGEELSDALATLRARYVLQEVGRLDVPYYQAIGGGSQNRRVPLYRIEPLAQ